MIEQVWDLAKLKEKFSDAGSTLVVIYFFSKNCEVSLVRLKFKQKNNQSMYIICTIVHTTNIFVFPILERCSSVGKNGRSTK